MDPFIFPKNFFQGTAKAFYLHPLMLTPPDAVTLPPSFSFVLMDPYSGSIIFSFDFFSPYS